MKTPLNVLLVAIGYWIAVYGVTQVPNVINNYYLNLVWLTIIIPNVFHMIVGRVPQLAQGLVAGGRADLRHAPPRGIDAGRRAGRCRIAR